MKKKLVLADNPLKVRTLWSALSSTYGNSHWDPDKESYVILDYPVPPTEFPRRLAGGTNALGGFEPQFVPANKDRLSRIVEVCRDASDVYMFFDPTLEGEETSVYLLNAISPYIDFNRVHRIRTGVFTRKSIVKSFDSPVSFDHFSSDKSENLRILDRYIQYNVNTALGGKVIYDSDVGLCGYYILKLVIDRFMERLSYKSSSPEFKVAFRSNNNSLIRSDEIHLKREATKIAELCMRWLELPKAPPELVFEEQVIPVPPLYTLDSLALDATKDGSLHLSNIVSSVISMFHEGLITNPYSPQKVPKAYAIDVTSYIKSFDLVPSDNPPNLTGIVPIDIRLDMNNIKQSYRPVYRKIWQRTLQAFGIPTRLRKNVMSFRPKNPHAFGEYRFSGTYYELLISGFMGYFSKLEFEPVPDAFKEVVLDKQESKRPKHHTEYSILTELLSGSVFSALEVQRALSTLQDAGFLRTGTSNFLIPTFRGIVVGLSVFKHAAVLGQLSWIKDAINAVSQTRSEARMALSNIWHELKFPFQSLEKHKFSCSCVCPSCKSSLDVVFDKEREPYLLCKKGDSSGCGAVYTLCVDSKGEIKIFEPYSIDIPCPKCELSTMRCHNGPYGLFVRCDSCNSTQPFD